jgi:arylsulfatase A-like enzyme
MVENIDYNLGRLMKFLKDTGRDEDTIVIMVNDNGVTEGLDVYNANMRGPSAPPGKGAPVPFPSGDGQANGNQDFSITSPPILMFFPPSVN